MGPGIASRLALRTEAELRRRSCARGCPDKGMPPTPLARCGPARARRLRPDAAARAQRVGAAPDGDPRGRRHRTRRRAEPERRPICSFWLTTAGSISFAAPATRSAASPRRRTGRPTTASPAATATARSTRSTATTSAAWRRVDVPVPNTARLQVTPVVVDGVMYVTSANECYALDAGTGRQIWHYQRPRTKGLAATPPAASTAASASPATACSWSPTTRTSSRSTASPARCCGKPRWPTGARTTTPPARRLPVGNLVVSGTSGGDEGVRGFVAAFDQATGKEVWRFWTVPKPRRAGLGDLAGQRHRAPRRPRRG